MNVKPSDIEKFLNTRYDFRRNPVLDRTEFKEKRSDRYKLLTERDLNSLVRVVRAKWDKITVSYLKSLLNSDFITEIDPFLSYFESLPSWEMRDNADYIGELANTITVLTHNDEEPSYWQEYFKKWLVAAVACAVDEEKVNHQVLVLVGSQGLGKSTWLNSLLPKALNGYLYSGLIDPNNKDTLVHLAENLFVNLDELENLNKTELGSLKSLITQSAIKLRKAYAVFNENIRRRASFMGSVNDAEFLNDTTGNRRYLCFTCTAIDYQHKVDMDLVYAQAYALYKSKKFKYYFDAEDIPAIERINALYLRISTEEDLLLKHFEPAKRGEEGVLEYTPIEILKIIEKKEDTNIFDKHTAPRRIGQALQRHGFIKISKNNRRPYLLKKKEEETAKKVAPDTPSIEDEYTDPNLSQQTATSTTTGAINPNEAAPAFPQDALPLPEAFKRLINENFNGDVKKGISEFIEGKIELGKEPTIMGYKLHIENRLVSNSKYNNSIIARIKEKWDNDPTLNAAESKKKA